MKVVKLVSGFLFMIAVIAITVVLLSGSNLFFFLDLPSLLLVLICPFVLILIQYGPASIGRNFSIALDDISVEKREASSAEYYFQTWGIYVLLTGGIFFIVGIIMVLSNIQDKETIGAGLACSLITFLYGLIITITLTRPLAVFCRQKNPKN